MTRIYDIMLEHGEVGLGEKSGNIDMVSTSPYAIIAVWRYVKPVTYSRSLRRSATLDTPTANRVREKVLVICDDIRSVSVTTTKTNHVGQISVTMYPGMNYLHELFPGDHMACWMVNSKELAEDLITRIQKNQTCNGFMDGLKFMGRVAGIRKNINQSPTGVRTTTYTLMGGSFTELDASIYLDEHLSQNEGRESVSFLKSTGAKIAEVIKKGGGGGIESDLIMPLMLGVLFGKGVPKNMGATTGLNNTAGLDNPDAMVIPEPAAKILGVARGTKESGQFAYTDILEFVHGVQNYQLQMNSDVLSETAFQPQNRERSGQTAAAIFTPDGLSYDPLSDFSDRRRFTGKNVMGTFLPIPSQFTGQRTVWSILEQYLNKTVNEMYATLRVSPSGRVFPTVVMRQLPFSSGVTSDSYQKEKIIVKKKQVTVSKKKKVQSGYTTADGASGVVETEVVVKQKVDKEFQEKTTESVKIPITRFSELPRWVAHPALIRALDVGRSDAVRCNFVHIYGDPGFNRDTTTNQIVRDPPAIDIADINRSGLRPYIATVPCAPSDVRLRKSAEWMFLMSDILMGQHLTLSGQVSLVGVQAPICIGDNFEFDGHIFHIESVNHNFTINPNGIKAFSTTLALSYGQKVAQLAGDDFSIYTGVGADDLTMADPPASTDYSMSPTKRTEGRPDTEQAHSSESDKVLGK